MVVIHQRHRGTDDVQSQVCALCTTVHRAARYKLPTPNVILYNYDACTVTIGIDNNTLSTVKTGPPRPMIIGVNMNTRLLLVLVCSNGRRSRCFKCFKWFYMYLPCRTCRVGFRRRWNTVHPQRAVQVSYSLPPLVV